MSGLSQERLENLLTQCRESAATVAESLAPNLAAEDLAIEVRDPQAGLAELEGTEAETTALAVVRDIGDLFTLFYLDPGPIRPDWWGDSMSGQEQLAAITAALARLVSSKQPTAAPDLMWEKSLADAADLHDFPDDVTVLPFDIVSGDKKGHAFLVAVATEPAEQPAEQPSKQPAEASAEFAAEASEPESEQAEKTSESASESNETAEASESEPDRTAPAAVPEPPKPAAAKPASPRPQPPVTAPLQIGPAPVSSFEQLPVYARTLLHVKVPVVVTLATKKESVNDILNLSPGTILQFKKSCEEPLDLSVGSRPVAKGEAVKVGEKFGLRIMSMLLPSDRHITLKPKSDPVSV